MNRFGAILLALSSPAFAQSYDHLEPDDSILGSEWRVEYYSNVARVLGDVLPDNAPKVYVLPSNINEYVIGINHEEDMCFVVVGRVAHTLWLYESSRDEPDLLEHMAERNFPEDPLDVEVEISAQPASTDLCNRIRDVWEGVLLNTRYPDLNEAHFGVDGVSFHFETWIRGMGTLSGKTWSPDRQTIPGKLVRLSGSMRAYARSGTDDDHDLMMEALAELEGALE